MKLEFKVNAIGQVQYFHERICIKVYDTYKSGLTNIEGFSHLQIIWWGHLSDNSENRRNLIVDKLFKKGPDQVGIFATRAPSRPNPILISTIKVEEIDTEKGIIFTPFIDADQHSPVLDIKPYFPMERVKAYEVPTCFEHWPRWAEDAEHFNWKEEINY